MKWYRCAKLDPDKSRIAKLWALLSVAGLLYLVGYSILESTQSELYQYWTELFEPAAIYLGKLIPSLERAIDQVTDRGYFHRIPYIEHMFSFTLFYVAVCLLILIANFKEFIKYLAKEEARELNVGGVILGYIFSAFSCSVVLPSFFSGFEIVDYTLRGGFKIHVRNDALIGPCFFAITLAQCALIFFVLSTGRMILLLKEKIKYCNS